MSRKINNFYDVQQLLKSYGFLVTNQEELEAAIKEGYETDGPVLIDIPVNYKDNIKLSTNMLPDVFN